MVRLYFTDEPVPPGETCLTEAPEDRARAWAGLGKKLNHAPPRAGGTGSRMVKAQAEQASPASARVHFVGAGSQKNEAQERA